MAEKVGELTLADGRHAKAWPWLQRAPRLTTRFPWMATFFVPLYFPYSETTFLPSLAAKGLAGTAGELTVTVRTSRNGKEGVFFRFGLDEEMRESLKTTNFVLRFSIHRVTIFVSPNRFYPGNENLVIPKELVSSKDVVGQDREAPDQPSP